MTFDDCSGWLRGDHNSQYSEPSREIERKPDPRYSPGITDRSGVSSPIPQGVMWIIGGGPIGLVDDESIRSAWPQTDNFRLRVLTFRSDHKHTTARVILKTYGGMSLEVKEVRPVEGWYCD